MRQIVAPLNHDLVIGMELVPRNYPKQAERYSEHDWHGHFSFLLG